MFPDPSMFPPNPPLVGGQGSLLGTSIEVYKGTVNGELHLSIVDTERPAMSVLTSVANFAIFLAKAKRGEFDYLLDGSRPEPIVSDPHVPELPPDHVPEPPPPPFIPL